MISLKSVCLVTKGVWCGKPPSINDEEQELTGVCFDTRNYYQEDIFIALTSDKGSANFHLPKLDGQPVKLIIIEQDVKRTHKGAYYLKVDNSMQALHLMARAVIDLFKGLVVAVTGSSGKTTFKHWLSCVLEKKYKVYASPKSYNNHIGVPISILNCALDADILILEMGTNSSGEILELVKMARPHISILLNVGMAHLGKFGSMPDVYLAKQEIFQFSREPKLAFIPADDSKIKAPKDSNVITFGEGSDLYDSKVIGLPVDGITKYEILIRDKKLNFSSSLIGEHVAHNLSGIISVSDKLEVRGSDMIKAIGKLANLPGRLQLVKAINGGWLIDDSYNANPNSVINLLNTIVKLDFSPKTLVLGDMAELGGQEELVVNFISERFPSGVDNLIIYGNFANILGKALLGKRPDLAINIIISKDQQSIHRHVKEFFSSDSLVAFKGSRVTKIENILRSYIDRDN